VVGWRPVCLRSCSSVGVKPDKGRPSAILAARSTDPALSRTLKLENFFSEVLPRVNDRREKHRPRENCSYEYTEYSVLSDVRATVSAVPEHFEHFEPPAVRPPGWQLGQLCIRSTRHTEDECVYCCTRVARWLSTKPQMSALEAYSYSGDSVNIRERASALTGISTGVDSPTSGWADFDLP